MIPAVLQPGNPPRPPPPHHGWRHMVSLGQPPLRPASVVGCMEVARPLFTGLSVMFVFESYGLVWCLLLSFYSQQRSPGSSISQTSTVSRRTWRPYTGLAIFILPK